MPDTPVHRLTATDLSRHLQSGELTSAEVVEALISRRRAVDPAVNAFTQVNESALDDARRADQERRRGEVRGPLHGVPVTIKDNLDIAGMDSTLGLRARHQMPAAADAVLVAELRRQGAVILGKTNVPQLLLAQETENDVYGVTGNPWNTDRVPGGSSGGEAAAIATGMSPMGIGTDIGGSIRIPAHFCGIAGFKPSLDRWSNRGSQTGIPGQEVVRAQAGPMARSVADLSLMWKTLSTDEQAGRDPQVPPLPPGDPDAIDLRGMRIGLYDTDDLIEPMASLRRATRRAAEVLEEAGAVIVPFTPTPSAEVLLMWMAAISSDGGATMDRSLGGEPASPQLRPSRLISRLPGPARKLAALALERLGQERLARLMDVLGRKPVEELWRLTDERTQLRRQELDAWRASGIDALVCPAHVVPAMRHRESADFTLSIGPCARWSLLAFPAGVVPVARVVENEQGYEPARDKLDDKVRSIGRGSAGLPVGVQVVTPPFRDARALAVMRAIELGVATAGEFQRPMTPIEPSRGEGARS